MTGNKRSKQTAPTTSSDARAGNGSGGACAPGRSPVAGDGENCVIPDIVEPEAPAKGRAKTAGDTRKAGAGGTGAWTPRAGADGREESAPAAEVVVDDVDDLGEGFGLPEDIFAGDDEADTYDIGSGEEDGGGVSLPPARRTAGGNLPAVRGSNLPSPKENLRAYIAEVNKFPLLEPEEEKELTRRFRDTRDPEAAFRIISSHLRLVVSVALSFQRTWMKNVLDVIQEGNVGLMHALYKFNPDKGIKFAYYAKFWIRAYILKFIMDNYRMVKLGTTQVQRKLFFNLNKERQKLIAQGFDPDDEMLSRQLGVSVEDIRMMDQRLSSPDVSLNTPVGDEENTATRMDFMPALGPGVEESIAGSEISMMVRSRLATLMPELSDKETYILHNRLLSDSPLTLREIGERFHVTRERVRQLEIRLLDKIRKHLAMDIRDFSEEWITD